MLHYSPGLVEVGVFDVDESRKVSADILAGVYPSEQRPSNGRFTVPQETIDEIAERIELLTFEDFLPMQERRQMKTNMYTQLLAQVDTADFPGYPWHVDHAGDRHSGIGFRLVNFGFGSDGHTTQSFEGELDLTEAFEYVLEHHTEDEFTVPTLPAVLALGQTMVGPAISQAVEKGLGRIVDAHPGALYKIPEGSVHRTREIDLSQSYLPRFCIEKYL